MPGPYQIEINKALAPIAAIVAMAAIFVLSAGLHIENPAIAAVFGGLIAFAIGYVSTAAAAAIIVVGSIFLFIIINGGMSNSSVGSSESLEDFHKRANDAAQEIRLQNRQQFGPDAPTVDSLPAQGQGPSSSTPCRSLDCLNSIWDGQADELYASYQGSRQNEQDGVRAGRGQVLLFAFANK